MDIIFPSVLLTLKPLCPKKLVFALANVIDTDQGNPFEVVLLSKAYFILAGEKSFFAHIGKLGLGPAILEARTTSSLLPVFLNQVPIILSVSL
jgi:hypothetical protein